jgi:ubiquitin-protein ligase
MLRRLNNEMLSAPRTGPIRYIQSVTTNHQHWQITCEAGETHAFSGATLDIDVLIPEGYPFKMPTLRVRQHVYHPNFLDGQVCLGSVWSTAVTIHYMVSHLYNLIIQPDAEAILCHDAYVLFKNDRDRYTVEARRVLTT